MDGGGARRARAGTGARGSCCPPPARSAVGEVGACGLASRAWARAFPYHPPLPSPPTHPCSSAHPIPQNADYFYIPILHRMVRAHGMAGLGRDAAGRGCVVGEHVETYLVGRVRGRPVADPWVGLCGAACNKAGVFCSRSERLLRLEGVCCVWRAFQAGRLVAKARAHSHARPPQGVNANIRALKAIK